jgi:sugar phosphate isomerase/epimerase
MPSQQYMAPEQNHESPKFGLLTDPIEFVPDQISRFHRLGFDYVEIGIEEPNATPGILMRQKGEILSLLSTNGMPALGHTAYWVGFGSCHEKVRLGWIEEAKDMILVASELKIELLNFHFYTKLGRVGATEESRNFFLRNFTDAMEELTRYGATKKVELMLENGPPGNGSALESIECFSHVMKAVPDLKFHLDVGHAFIENRMKGVRDYINAFGGRLAHVHMHDNHGRWDEHLPLGRGKIDFRKVVRFLKEINYDRTVTFEVFTSRADAVRSRELFKKQWNKVNP